MFDELEPLFRRWWELRYKNRFHRYWTVEELVEMKEIQQFFGVGLPLIVEGRKNSEYGGNAKSLIDEHLRALNWNLADFTQITKEYPIPGGERADYAIFSEQLTCCNY